MIPSVWKRVALGALMSAAIAIPASANLALGTKAPMFTATASMAGKEFKF